MVKKLKRVKENTLLSSKSHSWLQRIHMKSMTADIAALHLAMYLKGLYVKPSSKTSVRTFCLKHTPQHDPALKLEQKREGNIHSSSLFILYSSTIEHLLMYQWKYWDKKMKQWYLRIKRADYICQWKSCDGMLFFNVLTVFIFSGKVNGNFKVWALKWDKCICEFDFTAALMAKRKKKKRLSLTYQVVQLSHCYVTQV